MNLIDTHTHIYLDDFDDDRDDMIQRALEQGVEKLLLPNIDEESIDGMLQLENQFPNQCFPMMGLHPTSVNENYKKKLDVIRAWLQRRKFCAIGEIGIDLYWDKTFLNEQKDAFSEQILLAIDYNLPIVIHARDSFNEIFEVLDSHANDKLKGVFHSFGGSIDQAEKALSYKGFKLGINGVVTFKNSGLDKVIEQLSLSDLVLETDAPYLTPTPFRGKRNEPAYLSYIVDKLSEIYGVSKEDVANVTTQNAKALFNL
ncbi:TatD family hydrolase [bacterium]|nr:TatD family hydrolase [bacterium]